MEGLFLPDLHWDISLCVCTFISLFFILKCIDSYVLCVCLRMCVCMYVLSDVGAHVCYMCVVCMYMYAVCYVICCIFLHHSSHCLFNNRSHTEPEAHLFYKTHLPTSSWDLPISASPVLDLQIHTT